MIVLQDGTEAVLEKGTDVPKYSDAGEPLKYIKFMSCFGSKIQT